VLAELTAVLEFLFDDDVEDERDVQLAQLQRANDEPDTVDALAQALVEYAGLAEHYRDAIDGFGEFDSAMLDEATQLAARLRERSASRPPGVEVEQAMDWRNRLTTLLSDELSRVRAAARFVFRHHPQIRQRATSAYQRRSRAARRRAAAAANAA